MKRLVLFFLLTSLPLFAFANEGNYNSIYEQYEGENIKFNLGYKKLNLDQNLDFSAQLFGDTSEKSRSLKRSYSFDVATFSVRRLANDWGLFLNYEKSYNNSKLDSGVQSSENDSSYSNIEVGVGMQWFIGQRADFALYKYDLDSSYFYSGKSNSEKVSETGIKLDIYGESRSGNWLMHLNYGFNASRQNVEFSYFKTPLQSSAVNAEFYNMKATIKGGLTYFITPYFTVDGYAQGAYSWMPSTDSFSVEGSTKSNFREWSATEVNFGLSLGYRF